MQDRRRRGNPLFMFWSRSARVLIVLSGFLVACYPVVQARLPDPPANPASDAAPACRVDRVIDGDTVDMTCPGGPGFRARLTGFDTPETYEPGCAAEARLGRQATLRLRELVGGARTVGARLGGVDRYGRRLVSLELDGRDVGGVLISEGLAVPYSGGRRINWCARTG